MIGCKFFCRQTCNGCGDLLLAGVVFVFQLPFCFDACGVCADEAGETNTKNNERNSFMLMGFTKEPFQYEPAVKQ
jgi:hypothetical protein